jgi:glycosyltransferase involved in cell wall biosynthesis
LTAAGARVTIVQRFHRRTTLDRRGAKYVFTPSPTLELARRRASVGVAHVNGLIFPGQTWSLRRLLARQCPIVIQDHGSQPPADGEGLVGTARRRIRRQLLGAADGFLFASAEQGDGWRSAGLIAPSQRVYEVMPASTSFVPVPREVARAKTSITGTPALLWVGRLNANKDPLTVLSGFERCLPSLRDGTLTMIFGKDEMLAAVRARVEASALLQPRVCLIGSVPHDDLPFFYSAADLFVVGSHHEGSGYSLIEACACGATPVVTDIPSFRAITGRGAVGALWTPGDAAGFAHALEHIAGRDLEAQRLDVVRHFERTLNWEIVGRRAMDIYRDLVAARSGKTRLAGPR